MGENTLCTQMLCFPLSIHFAACKVVFKPMVVPALRALARIISKIVYFFKMDDSIVDTIFSIVGYLSKIQCDTSIECDYPTTETYDAEFGALPVATRCWADYSPEIDTTNSFACTPSDTCRVSELNYGTSLDEYGSLTEDGNQIVCDSCPIQPGGLVNQFGCDTFTKQCTCNR